MKNFLQKIFKKKSLLYNKQGVSAKLSSGKEIVIKWSQVNKIIVLNVFEEYSGYFLTDDYLNKKLYQDISIDCKQNVVKIRTGGAPTVKKNTSDPFSRNFGTTSIYYPVFIEYTDESGNRNLFASHYDENKRDETIKELIDYLSKDKVIKENKIEGFTPLSQL